MSLTTNFRTAILFQLVVACLVCCPDSNAAEAQPDIVIIMADDMGYSDIGCFGGEIETPNLDSLANGGLRFTNFYSENMCWVSRAAMLTGVYHKTSMYENGVHPRCVTIPEALKQNGYGTKMSGKWHLAGRPYHIFPVDRGFDEYYGILGGASSFYAPAFLTRNRTNAEKEANDDPDFYFTDAISAEADRMIRETDAGVPLFLSVAYTAAHWPLHAPQNDVAAYKGKFKMGWDQMRKQRLARMKKLGIVSEDLGLSPRHRDVPAWEEEPNKAWQQRRMEVYAAQVTVMDRGIGRIIQSLKEVGRFDNTLLFFTVDNGGCHVEYGADRKGDFLPEKTRDGRPMRPGNLPTIMPGPEDTYQSYGYGWANASNTPYRMFKQYDHEGGIRTPMIAHWPKGISNRGALVKTVSHLIDIMPTVLEVSDTITPDRVLSKEVVETAPIKMDGHSLAPIFQGDEIAEHKSLFFDHAKGKALRCGDWKIVVEKKSKNLRWELYDLKADPLETDDLAQRNPRKLEELKAIWQAESKRLDNQAKIE